MNPLPISPAIVAALNQWGLIGNMNQNQNQDQVRECELAPLLSPHRIYRIKRLLLSFTLLQPKYDNFKGGNQPWSRQQGNGPPSQGGNEHKAHFI